MIPGCGHTDKTLGSSKQTGLEVLQKVDTGDVGTTEMSESLGMVSARVRQRSGSCRPEEQDLPAQSSTGRAARPGEVKMGLKQNPLRKGGCGICVIRAWRPTGGSIYIVQQAHIGHLLCPALNWSGGLRKVPREGSTERGGSAGAVTSGSWLGDWALRWP